MRHAAAFLAALFVAIAVAGCPGQAGNGAPKAARKVAYPVETEVVQGRTIDYNVTAIGSVEAFEVVQVTARVAGTVEEVLFREGQSVTAGHVMVRIEPRRYALEVASAKAAESRAKAQYDDAEAGLKRRTEAVAKSPTVFSPEEIETWKTRTAVAKAEWVEEEVNVKRAELNEEYSRPASPFEGVIQTRTVRTGQYVQPGAVLATLIRRDPMLLRFSVPERDALAISVGQRAAFRVSNATRDLGAKVIHVAASAEGASRLVAITAEVDPADSAEVRPGSFAQVTVTVASRSNAPSVPETAVRPSAEGFLAYVVEEGVARKRVLQIGLRTGDGRVEVLEGIKPGETLVIRGGEALSDGVSVQISGAPGKGAAK